MRLSRVMVTKPPSSEVEGDALEVRHALRGQEIEQRDVGVRLVAVGQHVVDEDVAGGWHITREGDTRVEGDVLHLNGTVIVVAGRARVELGRFVAFGAVVHRLAFRARAPLVDSESTDVQGQPR